MDNQHSKKFKKAWWVVGGIALVVAIVGIASGNSNTQTPAPATQTANIAQQVAPLASPTPPQKATLSNDSYYTNSNGNTVHSPAYSSNGVPAGATAQCRDTTYSFSQHRSGTCSGHGGVATWL